MHAVTVRERETMMQPEMLAHGENPAARLPTGADAWRLAQLLVASLLLHGLLFLLPALPESEEGKSGTTLGVQIHFAKPVTAAPTAVSQDGKPTAAQAPSPQMTISSPSAQHREGVAAIARLPTAPVHIENATATPSSQNAVDQENNIHNEYRSDHATVAAMTVSAASPDASGANASNPSPVALTGGELSLLCPHKQPDYPPLSQRQSESGRVELNVHVGSDGRINSAWVKRTSGSPRLDRAAIAEVMSWQCKAPERNGERVDVVVVQPFTFSMN